jgi:hypothetical protein
VGGMHRAFDALVLIRVEFLAHILTAARGSIYADHLCNETALVRCRKVEVFDLRAWVGR